MRLSRYFLPVLKENPAEAQIVSHRLMLRAGMIKQSAAGIYSWLPLGLKVLKNIETIVHQDYCRLNSEDSNQTAINLLIESGSTEAYILGPDKSFLGKVALQTLLKGAPDGPAIAEQEVDPISIKSDASLQQAIEIAVDFVGESIPVIDRATGGLIGIVTEADLFRDYLALQNRVVDLERR